MADTSGEIPPDFTASLYLKIELYSLCLEHGDPKSLYQKWRNFVITVYATCLFSGAGDKERAAAEDSAD